MLDYNTCVKLKEAGFPFKGDHFIFRYDEDGGEHLMKVTVRDDQIIPPTLSELIEACGAGFENLYQFASTHKWACNVTVNCMDCTPEGWDDQQTLGDTPEEAVANLYLALKQ